MSQIDKSQAKDFSALVLAILFQIEKGKENKSQRFVKNIVNEQEEYSFCGGEGCPTLRIVTRADSCDICIDNHCYQLTPANGAAELLKELRGTEIECSKFRRKKANPYFHKGGKMLKKMHDSRIKRLTALMFVLHCLNNDRQK